MAWQYLNSKVWLLVINCHDSVLLHLTDLNLNVDSVNWIKWIIGCLNIFF